MVKVGFFILAGLDEQIGMLNGFLTGLLLSFPPPLPQPIHEGADEEERQAGEREDVVFRQRPMEHFACCIDNKEQTRHLCNSDYGAFFRYHTRQVSAGKKHKHQSRSARH